MYAKDMALDIWEFGNLKNKGRRKYSAICDICRYHRSELKLTGRTILTRDCNKSQYRCESSFRVICANLDCLAKSGQQMAPRFICLKCNEAVYHEAITQTKNDMDDDYSDEQQNTFGCTNMLELHAIICDGRPKWRPHILELQGDWNTPEGSVTVVGYNIYGMDDPWTIEEIRGKKLVLNPAQKQLNYDESRCDHDTEGRRYVLTWGSEAKRNTEVWTRKVEYSDRIGAEYPGGRPRVTRGHKLRKRVGKQSKKDTAATVKLVNTKFGSKDKSGDDDSSEASD